VCVGTFLPLFSLNGCGYLDSSGECVCSFFLLLLVFLNLVFWRKNGIWFCFFFVGLCTVKSVSFQCFCFGVMGANVDYIVGVVGFSFG